MTRTRLLVLSGGSLVGQNVLDCLEPYRSSLIVIGTTTDPAAPCNFRYDAVHTIPPARDEAAWSAAIIQLIACAQPALVIPTSDEDLVSLARFKERHGTASSAFLCGSSRAAETFHDKFRSWQFAHAAGLPFAASAIEREAVLRLLDGHGPPLIAKPRYGFGSNGVYLLRDRSEVLAALDFGGFVFQEYLPAVAASPEHREMPSFGVPLFFTQPAQDDFTGQAMVGPDGVLAGLFCSRTSMEFGKVVRSERVDCPDFAFTVGTYASAAAALGHVGPLNIQCRRIVDRGYVVFEINGRFTGSTSARALHGFDEVATAIALFTGRTLPQSAQAARIVARLSTDRVIDPADVAGLAASGIWTRPSR
jgi:carbamoyl-phosphate synthase large subunit